LASANDSEAAEERNDFAFQELAERFAAAEQTQQHSLDSLINRTEV